MQVRAATERDLDHLARVWYDSWQDAHAPIVPDALKEARTLSSFRQRLHDDLASVGVVGPEGRPAGFYMVKGDERYQLFVDAEARGTGAAVALIDAAEARLAGDGVATAWLACAIGNVRAARFYEKRGWHLVGTVVSQLETANGIIPLEVWRYEKQLVRTAV
jgi:GNAT superfamily N-acetyltransferase